MINSQLHSVIDLDDGFCNLIIFKKFYSSKEKKLLKYSDFLKLLGNKFIHPSKKFLLNNEIEVINNTKEEIKDLIEEFVQKKNKIWNN